MRGDGTRGREERIRVINPSMIVVLAVVSSFCFVSATVCSDDYQPWDFNKNFQINVSVTTEPTFINSFGLTLIEAFQIFVSSQDGPNCNFSPTCSSYGYDAVRKNGILLGVIMTADRLLRCNPWARGHYHTTDSGRFHDIVEDNALK